MSNINKQALREAAEKATCGVWSLEYGEERFDAGDALIHREVVGYLPICRIEGAHPESGFDEDFQMEQQANAEFITAANPATVLALLDELEKMQAQSSKWCEAFHKAVSVGARYEERIAELEAREISLPERSSMLHRTDFHEDYQTVMAYKVSEVIAAIRAAGIRIKGE
ncbi:ead/Ea22-like family protein [Escherichia coli 2-011-08_S4_C3]|uniref:ead/Ea22-like family protein n=1 Tax=Escherichia coli TaxID=562 RepID=UPI0004D75B4D|nr:ead/Ea22-like family protein [Escherichia coli]KDT06178.1 ead/Ea22-like family protein [Escherichia coli 2-011-08_S4_C1]KDT19198.1 ead/Ea22-like family protein [Escherichia coli 2-011-08_S4_C3]GDC94508.1 hypothetical protein HmCmsJML241_01873 [Escherichia coli]HAV7780812.1 ead/Ea22-like family protein [Escherichia coli]